MHSLSQTLEEVVLSMPLSSGSPVAHMQAGVSHGDSVGTTASADDDDGWCGSFLMLQQRFVKHIEMLSAEIT